MNLKSYIKPHVMVCNYISNNNLMIGIEDGSHYQFEGKDNVFDLEDIDDNNKSSNYSVWD